jgi:hypothetical protein
LYICKKQQKIIKKIYIKMTSTRNKGNVLIDDGGI